MPVFWPLQVDNPSCIWGRVFLGRGSDVETTEQYNSLMAQMNLFYHDVTQDLRKLKPASLEEGQVTPETHLIQAGDAFLIGPEMDWMCALLYFPAGVCGVLVSDEVMVSGSGGIDHSGLGVL